MRTVVKFLLNSLVLLSAYGVLNVANAATEEHSTARNVISDTAITAAIKSKFAADNELNALDIKVETTNGKVTLSGKVNNSEAAERAISIARNTDGVSKVVYKLESVWSAPNEKSTAGNVISDTAITAAIKSKYALDKEVNASDITVETVNRRVTLTGTVPSAAVAERAISIAQNTNGVKEVISNLTISTH